jgi:uncharacterized protein
MTDPLDLKDAKKKLKEADELLKRGLFLEARNAYQSLLNFHQTKLNEVAEKDLTQEEAIRKRIRILDERIREVEKRSAIPDAVAAPKTTGQGASDAESIFRSGLALKKIGFYEEAIGEFKKASDLQYRVSECHEEIGDSLIKMGFPAEGVKTFYQALQHKDVSSEQRSGLLEKIASTYEDINEKQKAILENDDVSPLQRVSILKKIASVYEEVNEKNKALEVYSELNELEKPHSRETEKPEVFAPGPQRFRFSLGIVCQHPWTFLIVTLLVGFFFMSFLPKVKTVNNVDYFTLKNDPDIKFYDHFKEVFGNDEFFVIAFEKENIFTKKNLTLLKSITEQVESLDDVRKVRSLANVDDTIGGEDYFEVKKFLEGIPESTEDLQMLKSQAIGNPLYLKNLISPDARTTAIVVFTQNHPSDENYRKRLLEKVDSILDPYRKQGEKFELAGWTTTNVSLAEYMIKDLATFIPITYLLIGTVIYFLFRNIRITLLALANIGICLGSTMGLFGLLGIRINNVTTIIPPVIMALSLSDTVHIFSHLEKRVLEEFPVKHQALTNVLDKVYIPCFLTTVTTAFGFVSYVTSSLSPLKDFAILGTAGMLFEYFYAFFFMPPLLLLLFDPNKVFIEFKDQRGMRNMLHHLYNLIQEHRKSILLICILMCGTAAWYTSKIKVETNLLEYFKASSPVRTAISFVEKRLSGVGTFDVYLQGKDRDAFKDPVNLKVVESIEDYIKTIKGVDVTTSFVDFMKKMNQSFHNEDIKYYRIPETKKLVAQYLLLYDSKDIEDVINATYDKARISVRISVYSSADQAKLLQKVREYLERINHQGLDIRITGRALQDVNIIDNVVKSQVSSLFTAAIPVFIIMFITLRSFYLGTLSIIPNVFPILLNFGIMGIIGIRLDTSTALISALALGIAVDDTTHFLYEYREKRKENFTNPDALKHCLVHKGLGMLSTATTMFIGFGVLVLSRFIPTINFGILNALIMVTGSIGDFLLLPAVMLMRKSKTIPR